MKTFKIHELGITATHLPRVGAPNSYSHSVLVMNVQSKRGETPPLVLIQKHVPCDPEKTEQVRSRPTPTPAK